MLAHRALQSLAPQLRGQFVFVQNYRVYSGSSGSESEEADLEAAREWYKGFKKSTIPAKLGQTTYARSSGPGGQKVNKTSSKAITVWPLYALRSHVPKVLHQGLLDSRYYVASSESISIQCDTARSQSDNKEETHTRLHDELAQIYKMRVPGVTSPEQKQKIEHLKKAENTMRLRAKKMHGDKKRSRSGGGNHRD
ncbi:related to Similarity to human DS-1 protein [Rhynchosporium graminicola]|uniref:Related to Similarity to human DS-1 protein n=2 Tax=Rhynchosporium TaxID=38037 RepID=A0A1E1M0L8_RHYSE|nr:related to Similarity to human DS-1 protein [Rhynchosporium commune]CZT42667.1 related to Similarity to human DS-1 protein [Rhynchosporium secalis]